MKKLICGSVLIWMLLLSGGGEAAQFYYTVEKGDTLSGIAEKVFGDYRKWEDLAKWNDLDVETIDGIDYVWLEIGQDIRLFEPEDQIDIEEMVMYDRATKKYMEQEIFRMAGIKNPTPRWEGVTTLTPEIIIQDSASIQQTVRRLENWVRELRIQGRYRIVEEIWIETLYNTKLERWFPDRHWWVLHRKVCLFILALIDVESNGYYARSHAGALGIYQFLPNTYRLTSGDTRDPKVVLLEENIKPLRAAITYLSAKKTMVEGLERYNPNDPGYVSDVISTYKRMLREAGGFEYGENSGR